MPESIVQKVEGIIRNWQNQTGDFEQIYKAGTGVFSEISALKKRKHDLGFNDLQYSILITLEDTLKYKCDHDANELYDLLKPLLFSGCIRSLQGGG